MIFLDQAELIELTGYKRAKYQIAQLKQMRVAYRVNARGKPVVAKDQVTGAGYVPHGWSPNVLASAPFEGKASR